VSQSVLCKRALHPPVRRQSGREHSEGGWEGNREGGGEKEGGEGRREGRGKEGGEGRKREKGRERGREGMGGRGWEGDSERGREERREGMGGREGGREGGKRGRRQTQHMLCYYYKPEYMYSILLTLTNSIFLPAPGS